MTEPKVRLVRKSDKEAILAFCQKLPNNQKDYIPLVWDKWICDPSGHIFVVTIDDIPVAMERVVRMSDSEAWKEGLRVAPRYRGLGISKILEFHINQYLIETNISTLRCCVYFKNKIMNTSLSKRGWVKVNRYSLYKAVDFDFTNKQYTKLKKLEQQEFNTVWSLVNDKDMYVSIGAKWQNLTSQELTKLIINERVWGFTQNNKLESIVIESKSETSTNKFWFGYINGNSATFTSLLQELKKLAYQKNSEYIGGFLPLNETFTTSFYEAGYQLLDFENCWIYEKNIN